MLAPQVANLSGDRLHLHHGPIDLIIKAWGRDAARAKQQATARFETVLAELAAELPQLRSAQPDHSAVFSPVGRRMIQTIRPFQAEFVTPMAAVAGAVADEICAAMQDGLTLDKIYVNNGGDISIYLAPEQSLTAAIHTGHNVGHQSGHVVLNADQPARGLATSGWRGRSYSFGIADSVTVLALNAATADVAATLIANAVTLTNHPAVHRKPANSLSPDSDLGDRLVTTDVGPLPDQDVETALSSGAAAAQSMVNTGVIQSAALLLNQRSRIIGYLPQTTPLNGDCDDHLQIA